MSGLSAADPGGEGLDPGLADLVDLAAVAGREPQVLAELHRCLDWWSRVQAAKIALAGLSADQLRRLLQARGPGTDSDAAARGGGRR